MKKIGITMRSSNAKNYDEPRDALARGWYRFLQHMDWGDNWILLPNLGTDILSYVEKWGIEGIVFSGGDDFGADLERDITEQALLSYCVVNNLPVLGVCRGAQLINRYYGGELEKTSTELHVANRHSIKCIPSLPWNESAQLSDVNSYHSNKLSLPLPDSLQGFAFFEQECEGFYHLDNLTVGVMWHPEREEIISQFDKLMFQWLFK